MASSKGVTESDKLPLFCDSFSLSISPSIDIQYFSLEILSIMGNIQMSLLLLIKSAESIYQQFCVKLKIGRATSKRRGRQKALEGVVSSFAGFWPIWPILGAIVLFFHFLSCPTELHVHSLLQEIFPWGSWVLHYRRSLTDLILIWQVENRGLLNN